MQEDTNTEYNFSHREEAEPEIKKGRYCRGSEEVVTEKLSVLLDRCSISDRDAVRIISATAEALGHDPQNLIISKSAIRLRRQQFRQQRTNLIKSRFRNSDLEGAVVHWDGKLLPDLLSKRNVERLAILITCGNEEQLIGVPVLDNSTGITQAKAVFSAVEQWGAAEKIQAMCFDTTAVNTGRHKGTCVVLEQFLGKNLLYLACRHHILEIVLKEVFNCKMGTSTGPQPDNFRKFQSEWSKIDKKIYKTAKEDENFRDKISNADQISNFLFEQLKNQQPRDDYKEFIQLCLICLGRLPPENTTFRVPGAIHHTRWMAKAIYCLKIYIFEEQFSLSVSESMGIKDICLFIINIYIKAWFTAHNPTMAPNQELKLVKSLVQYRSINKEIADKALSKIVNHLWYLNSEQIAFSFFDDTLEKNIKIRMVKQLKSNVENDSEENNSEDRDVKAKLSFQEVDNILDKEIDYFVSSRTLNFFKRFEINTDFLNTDPDEWCKNQHYLRAKKIVKGLKVVNDTAERGVKLIQDYNSALTKDEEQRQCLLQVVSECRHLFPDSSKVTLSKPLPP